MSLYAKVAWEISFHILVLVTITITLTDKDIEYIKTIVKTSPGFTKNNFRWPIVGKDIKFVSKVNLDEDYENI